jgi:hypothetical protein
MTILFLHGWHSVPGGVQATYLAQHGHVVIEPVLDDDDFDGALATAQAEFDKHQPKVVVGSSRGGAIAMNMNTGEARLVLLCPAWHRWGTASTATKVKANTVILHSRADDLVPFADSEELVRTSGLPAWTLIEVGNDHRLEDPESMEMMLEACLVDDDDETVQEEAKDILEKDWTGLCYTAALQWVREAEEEWFVVHGTVWSDQAGKRIEHAWCEQGRWVVDLAMPVGSRVVAREAYYRAAKPEVAKRYSADDAVLLAIKNQHDGPWDESEQLK